MTNQPENNLKQWSNMIDNQQLLNSIIQITFENVTPVFLVPRLPGKLGAWKAPDKRTESMNLCTEIRKSA